MVVGYGEARTMENKKHIPQHSSHPGGDTQFWRDERVQKYDYQQSLLSEKKDEVLTNIVRIVNYFCKQNSISSPQILDIGCGPGTPMTLSAYILDKVSNSIVIGVDSSDQMIEAAKSNLTLKYGQRFHGYIGDFNTAKFWISDISHRYDFVVSNGTLHYLSDRRRTPFFREVFNHTKDDGVLVCCMANCSTIPEIVEMGNLFRVEFTYNQLGELRRPDNFQEFRKRFEETDRRANINWRSRGVWIEAMRRAGFKRADTVWHL